MRPANERRRYFVTTSLIDFVASLESALYKYPICARPFSCKIWKKHFYLSLISNMFTVMRIYHQNISKQISWYIAALLCLPSCCLVKLRLITLNILEHVIKTYLGWLIVVMFLTIVKLPLNNDNTYSVSSRKLTNLEINVSEVLIVLDDLLNICCQIVIATRTCITWIWHPRKYHLNNHIGGLLQDCSISIANALKIMQSCTKPSTYLLSWKCPGVFRSYACYNLSLGKAEFKWRWPGQGL